MTTYRAEPWRQDHGYELHIDGMGVTRCEHLKKAEATVRDCVAAALGVPADSFDVEIGQPGADVRFKRPEAGDFSPNSKSAKGQCAQGGSGACGVQDAEFTVIYRNGEKFAACDKHLVTFIRTTLNGGG